MIFLCFSSDGLSLARKSTVSPPLKQQFAEIRSINIQLPISHGGYGEPGIWFRSLSSLNASKIFFL